MSVTAREVKMVARPDGAVKVTDFAVSERELPALAPGEVLVRNRYVSVDPYMRAQMSGQSIAADYTFEQVFGGATAGEVVQSTVDTVAIGDVVTTSSGWCDHAVVPATAVAPVPAGVDPADALSVFGMPGMTAWAGMTRLGRISPGETVLVSGVSGAVGIVAAQLALAGGCEVVGLTGSAGNLEALRELGITPVDRRADDPVAALAAAAPQGVDLFFDNVAGTSFELGLTRLNENARIVVCGSMASMDSAEPDELTVSALLMRAKRVRMEGLVVTDYAGQGPAFLREMSTLLRTGRLRPLVTRVPGIERAAEAFVGLFGRESHLGKVLVEV